MRYLGRYGYPYQSPSNFYALDNSESRKESIVYFSIERGNDILNSEPLRDNQNYHVYKFNTYQEYYDFEIVREKITLTRIADTLNNPSDLLSCLDKVKALAVKNQKSEILHLIMALLEFFMHNFGACIKNLNTFIELVEDDSYKGKSFATELLTDARNNLMKIEELQRRRTGVNTCYHYFIGCKKEYVTEFRESTSMYIAISNTNQYHLNTVTKGNITYYLNSFLCSKIESLIDLIAAETPDTIIFNVHSGQNNGENALRIDFTNNRKIQISFDEIYNQIRKKFGDESIIIVLGCNLSIERGYCNVVYYTKFILSDVSVPFIYAFLFMKIYSKNSKDNFELAKTFTSLFSQNYKNLSMC